MHVVDEQDRHRSRRGGGAYVEPSGGPPRAPSRPRLARRAVMTREHGYERQLQAIRDTIDRASDEGMLEERGGALHLTDRGRDRAGEVAER